jgi:S1-C subfamily serine protease
VERTVEKVITVPSKTTVVPVQTSEEESIVKIINQAAPSIVKVYGDSLGSSGTGFVVAGQRIVSDTRSLGESKGGYRASLRDGRIANLTTLLFDASSTVAIFQIKDFEQKKDLIPSLLSSEAKTANLTTPVPELKLLAGETAVGQTAIGIGVDGGVSVGVISSSFQDASSSIIVLKTNAATGDNIGGPLLNIRGEVIGLAKAAGASIAVKTLAELLAGIK